MSNENPLLWHRLVRSTACCGRRGPSGTLPAGVGGLLGLLGLFGLLLALPFSRKSHAEMGAVDPCRPCALNQLCPRLAHTQRTCREASLQMAWMRASSLPHSYHGPSRGRSFSRSRHGVRAEKASKASHDVLTYGTPRPQIQLSPLTRGAGSASHEAAEGLYTFGGERSCTSRARPTAEGKHTRQRVTDKARRGAAAVQRKPL